MKFICNICPRNCSAIRNEEKGFGICKMPFNIKISNYSLHKWEEPCISGKNGSGTIFFSGCNLHCVYCQNYKISTQNIGRIISKEELINIMNELIKNGAHNINFVNPTHYACIIREILIENKFDVPIIYNCSGYEKLETIKSLNGLIDVYLPDLKYINKEISSKYSNCPDYFNVAKQAILEMCRQTGNCVYDENGMIKKGTIIRHLILPNNTKNTIEILKWCKENVPNTIPISIMSQYIPMGDLEKFPELKRKLNKIEYNKVLRFIYENNIENGYIQDLSSAKEKYIPNFN